MPHQLDRSRSFGTISGRFSDAPLARYEQDGRYFDAAGQEVSMVPRTASQDASLALKSVSSAAQRMQRVRDRRRAGILAVVNVEITSKVAQCLVARNLIDEGDRYDRAKLGAAAKKALKEWETS